MSKSRARYLAELLTSDGLVKVTTTALTGVDGIIDPEVLPTIANSQLEHSSISIAGHTLSLGGSLSLDTSDITEHASYLYYTDARVRGALSVSGSLAYNSSTGVISYTTPTTIASLSNHDTDDLSEGATNLYWTTARGNSNFDTRLGTKTTTDLTEGTNLYYTDTRVGSYLTTNSYATQGYVNTAVSNLVDSAPATLDTLNELAAALGDDPNFATTVSNSIGTKWTQDNTKISNWDTAYSWGDHASAGYLTSVLTPVNGSWWNSGFVRVGNDGVMEVGKYLDFHTSNTGGNVDFDLRVTASPNALAVGGTISATGGNSTNWNTAYGWGDHGVVGYLTSASLTGYATETYVNTAVSNLVDSAPATLDTLNELAAALGDDPNFATTVTNSIATKLPLAGGTLSGNLTVQGSAGFNSGGETASVYIGDSASEIRATYDGGTQIFVNAVSRVEIEGSTGNLNVKTGAIEMAGTTVIDSSRNLTNIGTLNGGTPWHSGNDGSGSGLDADLLDGNQATAFATAAQGTLATNALPKAGGTLTGNVNLSGSANHIIIGGTAGNNHYNTVSATTGLTFGGGNDFANYSIGTSSQDIGGNYTKLNIKWHTGIRFFTHPVYGGVRFHSDVGMSTELMSIGNSDGNVRVANNLYANGGNIVWSAGNDGSGSGLDADLLDGYNSAENGASVNLRTASNGYLYLNNWMHPANGTGLFYDTGVHFYESGNNMYSSTGFSSANQGYLWGASNDGSGSGLDADLLDGLQLHTGRNNEANKVVRTDVNGYIQAGWINTPSGDLGAAGIDRIYCSNDGYIRYQTPTNFRNSMISAGLVGGTSGKGTTSIGFASTANSNSGFYDVYNNGTPTGTWYSMLNMAHHGGNHGHQIAGSFYSAGDLFNRNNSNTSFSGWTRIWNAANDGSGSGLDADLLDGLQASSFVQQGGSYYTVGNTAAFSGANDTTLSVRSNGPAAATMSFHRPGVFAANFGLDTDNQLKYGGWSAVDVHPVMHDGVYGGSVSNATNGGGVNYVYVDGTVSYAPTRGSCGNHVYQCWGGALTLTLNDASWQRGDIVVFSNVRGAANIVVNAYVIYMPNGSNDNQVTWNATVGSFRLCKYSTTVGYWMVLP